MTKYDRLWSEMENLSCSGMSSCSGCLSRKRCNELSEALEIETDFIQEIEIGMLGNLDQLILNLEEA